MHLKKTVTLNISWGIQMKWKNKSSCSDLGYSNQRIKRHQSLTLNKWVHFQCRLLVGPQSCGSTIRSYDSFRESELSYFSSIWWSKRWKIYYFSELILPNISSKVRTCDTAITFFLLALLTKPRIYFSHSLVHGQVDESTAQTKMWEDKQYIFQCFIKLQQRL